MKSSRDGFLFSSSRSSFFSRGQRENQPRSASGVKLPASTTSNFSVLNLASDHPPTRASPDTLTMIGATRRWFQRNRKGLAIGAGVIGAGYLAGQYLLSKIAEARERMSSDRIAREKYVPAVFCVLLSLPCTSPASS